jgi:ribosomal protein L37E
MSDPKPQKPITPLKISLLPGNGVGLKADTTRADEKIVCDRCGGDVYRMHAVWRCSKCGYKSDCCGW